MKLMDDQNQSNKKEVKVQDDKIFQRIDDDDEPATEASDVLCLKRISPAEIEAARRCALASCVVCLIILLLAAWLPYITTDGVGSGYTAGLAFILSFFAIFIVIIIYRTLIKSQLEYKSCFIIYDKNAEKLQFWCDRNISTDIKNNNNNNSDKNKNVKNTYGKKIYDIGDRSKFIYASIEQNSGHSQINAQTRLQSKCVKLEFYFENQQLPYKLENPCFAYNDAIDIVDKINTKWGKINPNFNNVIYDNGNNIINNNFRNNLINNMKNNHNYNYNNNNYNNNNGMGNVTHHIIHVISVDARNENNNDNNNMQDIYYSNDIEGIPANTGNL